MFVWGINFVKIVSLIYFTILYKYIYLKQDVYVIPLKGGGVRTAFEGFSRIGLYGFHLHPQNHGFIYAKLCQFSKFPWKKSNEIFGKVLLQLRLFAVNIGGSQLFPVVAVSFEQEIFHGEQEITNNWNLEIKKNSWNNKRNRPESLEKMWPCMCFDLTLHFQMPSKNNLYLKY